MEGSQIEDGEVLFCSLCCDYAGNTGLICKHCKSLCCQQTQDAAGHESATGCISNHHPKDIFYCPRCWFKVKGSAVPVRVCILTTAIPLTMTLTVPPQWRLNHSNSHQGPKAYPCQLVLQGLGPTAMTWAMMEAGLLMEFAASPSQVRPASLQTDHN